MPAGKLVSLGVFDEERFVGVVIFGRGNSSGIGAPFGLDQTQVCELVRVALRRDRATPVSQALALAVRWLREENPGLRLVVSYADPNVGHHGGIYQAANWIYLGETRPQVSYRDAAGRRVHSRMVSASGGKKSFGRWRRMPRPDDLERVEELGRHKYVLPLDRSIRRRIAPLARPYPSRQARARDDG